MTERRGILAARGAAPDELRRPRREERRFRNRVRVLADLILQVGAIFTNLVGIDGATIFQVYDFGGSADSAQKQTRQ